MKPDLLRRYPRTAAPFHRLVTNQRLLILLLAMALLVLAACAQLGPLSPGTATSALGPADAAKTGQGWFLHLRGEAELTGHIGFQIIHRNITVDGFEVSRKNITVEVNPGDKLAMIGPRLVNKLRLWGIDVTCSAIKEDRFIIGISHADQPPQELLGGVAGLVLGTNGPILSFQELERCELGGLRRRLGFLRQPAGPLLESLGPDSPGGLRDAQRRTGTQGKLPLATYVIQVGSPTVSEGFRYSWVRWRPTSPNGAKLVRFDVLPVKPGYLPY